MQKSLKLDNVMDKINISTVACTMFTKYMYIAVYADHMIRVFNKHAELCHVIN